MNQAIVIIGGYNSLWPAYLKLARDLEALTGLPAIGVPLMPWHWWSARQHESAPDLLRKLANTVVWARRKFEADQFILVGHSAGGILARLYLCDQPVWGRMYAGVSHVSALITLGSPHCGERGTDTGWFLTDEANRLAPGTPWADTVFYRTVAGQHVLGCENGDYAQRRAQRAYRFFAGHGSVWGDGIVPVTCATLHGAESLLLEGVAHSRKYGSNWYGASRTIIRQWWPEGVRDAH